MGKVYNVYKNDSDMWSSFFLLTGDLGAPRSCLEALQCPRQTPKYASAGV